jgi:two-component system phosphate regulon sensor histidine kinase PhoR
MSLSLRARLFLGFALVLSAALGAMTLMAARDQREWLLRRHAESLDRAARVVDRELRGDLAAGDWPEAARALGRALDVRVTLIAREGRVIGDTDVPRDRLGAVENHRDRDEVRAALGGRRGEAVRLSHTLGVEFLYVAHPASVGEVAVVRVAEPLSALATLRASLLRLSFAAAAIALLLGLALAYWVAGRNTLRVRDLESVAARLGRGEPGARAQERPADELGRLGRALNQMSGELSARLEALARERDTRERILEHLRDGVALVDEAGHVIHVNHSLASLVGAPLPAEPGTPFHEFVRLPELDGLLREARAEARSVEAAIRVWSPQPRLLQAMATPLPGASGAVLLVLHDLTEVEAADRIRQDFVANVSHELRTPLTSLRGYAETLLEGGLADAAHREGFVRVIRDQAVRLEALLADLLALAELEHPGARLRLEPLDLREAVARQAAGLRPRAARAGLELTVEEGPAAPVRADRARLDQVIANLLDNAIKYTERGRIDVSLGADGARAWCEVRDTGPGIPREDQPRLFERFYRVDKARSREKGGTGLGLSIVKHIVLLHGGAVSVASEPGAGSTFRFEIPVRPDGS